MRVFLCLRTPHRGNFAENGYLHPLFRTFSTQFLEQSNTIFPKKAAKGWYLAISRPKTCVLRSVLLQQTNIFDKQTNKMGTKHPKNTPFGTQFRHFRVPRTPKMPQTCPELSTLGTVCLFYILDALRAQQNGHILRMCMFRR